MKPAKITSLPMSPEQDRHSRMIKYSLAMGIRLVCIVAIFFTPGWFMIIPAMGAIFLPYFAVIIANAHQARFGGAVEGPGTVTVYRADDPYDTQSDVSNQEAAD